MLISVLVGLIVFTICFFLVGRKKAVKAGLIAGAVSAVVFTVADIVALALMLN